jgi:hypothetical protein
MSEVVWATIIAVSLLIQWVAGYARGYRDGLLDDGRGPEKWWMRIVR